MKDEKQEVYRVLRKLWKLNIISEGEHDRLIVD